MRQRIGRTATTMMVRIVWRDGYDIYIHTRMTISLSVSFSDTKTEQCAVFIHFISLAIHKTSVALFARVVGFSYHIALNFKFF